MTDVLNPADHQSQPDDDREPSPAGTSEAVLVDPPEGTASGTATTAARPAPEPGAGTAAQPQARTGRVPADDALAWVGATANLGAAVVHFAYAQTHLDEQASHGAFFLAAGWAQLMLALGLALRARPGRLWAAASVAVNLGILGVWVVSRTVGVPGSDPESAGLADLTAIGLEAVAVLAGVVVLLGTLATRSAPRPGPAAIGVTALLVGGLVTASVTPAVAGDHAHAGGRAAHDMAGMEGMEGMDHGHAGGGTGDDFAATRLAALEGYLPPEEVERFRQVNVEYLSEQLRTRSEYLQSLPAAERERRIAEFAPWSVDNALKDEIAVAEGQSETMHTHGPTAWVPIEGTQQQAELQQQLRESGAVIAQYPTAADAVAAGYFQVTPYVPGIGAHYLNVDRLTDGEFHPGEPEMLLYNGNDPGSELVGLSYGVLSDTPPEGFVGQNDIWHQHPSLCLIDGFFVVGPDHTSEEMCASVGGRKGIGGEMQMAHVWQVPGWESSWGLFSGENPSLNMVTTDVGK